MEANEYLELINEKVEELIGCYEVATSQLNCQDVGSEKCVEVAEFQRSKRVLNLALQLDALCGIVSNFECGGGEEESELEYDYYSISNIDTFESFSKQEDNYSTYQNINLSYHERFIVSLAANCIINSKIERTKEISLDNGMHFLSAQEAMKELEKEECCVKWDNIALMMDDDTREKVHSDMAPCTNLEFLEEYLRVADEDLIIG